MFKHSDLILYNTFDQFKMPLTCKFRIQNYFTIQVPSCMPFTTIHQIVPGSEILF